MQRRLLLGAEVIVCLSLCQKIYLSYTYHSHCKPGVILTMLVHISILTGVLQGTILKVVACSITSRKTNQLFCLYPGWHCTHYHAERCKAR